MEAEYCRNYRELYGKHWWWRAREEAIVSTLRRVQPPGGFGPILDVGCGDGLFFDRLLEFGEPEGIEPDVNMLGSSSAHKSRIYVCPFDDNFHPGRQYGLILMLDVLEHLADAIVAVRNVRSLLRPGGMFLATVPAFQLLWTNHDVINHHQRRYTRKTLREVIANSGLIVCDEEYWFNWLFVPKLTTRMLEAIFRMPPRNPQIPPRWLNRSLYLLSRAENRLFSHLPVPFGSSVMALAQKPGEDNLVSPLSRVREIENIKPHSGSR